MATGGIEKGNPPFEAGASQRDMDYLHVINYGKAEKTVKAGKYVEINGFRVIPLKTAVEEGILYFVPEPKSPHGVDVTPDGEHIVVSGKLDPHVTIYHMDKIKKAIAGKDFEGTRRVRRADPAVRRRQGSAGRGRPGAAPHPVRRQGLRLHQLVPRQCRGPLDPGQLQVQGAEDALEARGQLAGPLQRRPHRSGRGRHGQRRTAGTWSR